MKLEEFYPFIEAAEAKGVGIDCNPRLLRLFLAVAEAAKRCQKLDIIQPGLGDEQDQFAAVDLATSLIALEAP